jgi:prepilin-type N-terminal cleavage/methylation domain-containing protein
MVTSKHRLSARERADEHGVTLIELVVALAVVLVVMAGVLKLAADARAFFVAQPEIADVTQRARAGLELFLSELTGAGAGPSIGDEAGPLIRWFPPVLPFCYQGGGTADPAGLVFRDRMTMIAAEQEVPLVAVRGAMLTADVAIPIGWQTGCPVGDAMCGFEDGQRVAIVDRTPAFELATVRAAWPGQIHHEPVSLAKAYRQIDGAGIVRVRSRTYYFDAGRRQLRRSTGPRADAPVLDEVVALSFRYFGDRMPPAEPRPPPGVATCLFDDRGNSRLAVLSPDEGELAELMPALLTDGPFCGVGAATFDADLYRVRRVRVTLRVQAIAAWVRGRDPMAFLRPGSATDPRLLVPDFLLVFDVTPRNLHSAS